MPHWTDPRTRGIYDDPLAPPPRPQSHASNDHGARLARQENHAAWASWDRQRIDAESRLRDRELGRGIMALESRVSTLEIERLKRRTIWKFVLTSAGSAKQLVRYLIGALIVILMLTGKASIESVKVILAALGFPTG